MLVNVWWRVMCEQLTVYSQGQDIIRYKSILPQRGNQSQSTSHYVFFIVELPRFQLYEAIIRQEQEQAQAQTLHSMQRFFVLVLAYVEPDDGFIKPKPW
jgi:hypothetical protein